MDFSLNSTATVETFILLLFFHIPLGHIIIGPSISFLNTYKQFTEESISLRINYSDMKFYSFSMQLLFNKVVTSVI